MHIFATQIHKDLGKKKYWMRQFMNLLGVKYTCVQLLHTGKELELEGVQKIGLVDLPITDSRVPVDSQVQFGYQDEFPSVLINGLDSRVQARPTSPNQQLYTE